VYDTKRQAILHTISEMRRDFGMSIVSSENAVAGSSFSRRNKRWCIISLTEATEAMGCRGREMPGA
jgi:hypothetical protein